MSLPSFRWAQWCALLPAHLATHLATPLTAFALVAAGAAQAQDTPPPRAALEPVIVTAARIAQPVGDLLADVTVIRPGEILRSGLQRPAALLRRQPEAALP